MAMHKRTTMLAHCNLKQNTWLCSKQSSFFPFMHCPLVANQKTRWSIVQQFYNFAKTRVEEGHYYIWKRKCQYFSSSCLTSSLSGQKVTSAATSDTFSNVNIKESWMGYLDFSFRWMGLSPRYDKSITLARRASCRCYKTFFENI